jgi:iron complex outermembrane receptor protein
MQTGKLGLRVAMVAVVAIVPAVAAGAPALAARPALEQVTVWGQPADSRSAGYTNPTSLLRPQDMVAINAATTEDLVKFEPSLVIRRRYIGDANGTLGIRGSNMFQTPRSMVFADGVPLHYLLQSRWSGAPRWTMVSASEIAQVEVIYGPFSAEYSGNAMGGVVAIETAIPQQREVHIDGSYFVQAFDAYGFDERVDGFKGFASVGDKIGDFSYYLSANHLDNDSQPQSFRFASGSASSAADTGSGALAGTDQYGARQWFYGDTGVETAQTNNYKLKLGYDVGHWQTLLNVAWEQRDTRIGAPNSYVRDLAGTPLWSGAVVQDGEQFTLAASSLGVSVLERESLSLGLRLKGQLSERLRLEANLNQFDILRDETRSSARNPADPAYTPAGQIADYDNSGWQAAEVKLIAEDMGLDGLQWINGLRHETYELNLDVYNAADWASGQQGSYRSRFGGQTALLGLYSQAN